MRALMQLTVPGKQLRGPRALAAVPRHVLHLAVEAGAQPIEEMRLVGGQIDIGHADAGKSELHPPALDVGREGGRVECRGLSAHEPRLLVAPL